MNYISLVNRFWQKVEMTDFSPLEACAYFRLLDVCNRLGWRNPFRLSTSRAAMLAEMDEKTFRTVRAKLAARGLIRFKKGSGPADTPSYWLPEPSGQGWEFPPQTPSTAGITGDTPDTTPAETPDTRPGTQPDKEPSHPCIPAITPDTTPDTRPGIPPAYNKNKTKTKTETESVCGRPAGGPPRRAPTHEEVRDYFTASQAARGLPSPEESAARFFEYHDAVGWRDRHNRRITRWQSRADSWIREDLDRAKDGTSHTTQNGNDKNDRFSERRGTEPRTQVRKGFKGTF